LSHSSLWKNCKHSHDDIEGILGVIDRLALLWALRAVNFEYLLYVIERQLTESKDTSHHASNNAGIRIGIPSLLDDDSDNCLIELGTQLTLTLLIAYSSEVV
jgi:hypothetical protein